VGGADQRPFAVHFVDATQQELPEASGLLDLSEDRFDDLFSEAIAAAVRGAFDRGPHRLYQRSPRGLVSLPLDAWSGPWRRRVGSGARRARPGSAPSRIWRGGDFDGFAAGIRGYPPSHPGVMTALLLYAYSLGVCSSRQIARACEGDLLSRR
jgi:Transposase domain (DUF772)